MPTMQDYTDSATSPTACALPLSAVGYTFSAAGSGHQHQQSQHSHHHHSHQTATTDHDKHGATTTLSGYATDLYGSNAASLQYYYQAAASYSSWSHQQDGSGGGGSVGGGGTGTGLLQYTPHGHAHGALYPTAAVYPSVITAAFGGTDLHGHDGGTHPFDPSILELRKEKSRDAARSRRGKENYEFYELAKMLPLPAAITSQLDKASIIRLTISFLKLRDFSGHGDPPWTPRDAQANGKTPAKSSSRRRVSSMPLDLFEAHQGTHILQSLDGFAFALSNDGRFLYISETVSIYLGLSQVEMTGSSLFDYVHTQDHQELADQLGLNSQSLYHAVSPTRISGGSPDDSNGATVSGSGNGATTTSSSSNTGGSGRSVSPGMPERTSVMNPSPSKGFARCFCIRMKSTLTKRGVHVKSSGYRVVQFVGHMRPQFSYSLTRKHPPPLLGLVGLAIALPPPTMTELVIDNDMFVTRLSPDLKVTYCEPRIGDMMDISADDLTTKNLYDYCHAEDLQKLRRAHIDLLGKGQVLTDYYRLMNKHGGYVWVQTCATVICNAKNTDDQNIIAINYVLSGVEYSGCVMNVNQLKVVTKTEPDQSDHSEGEQLTHDKEGKKATGHERFTRHHNNHHHHHPHGNGSEERHHRGNGKRKHSCVSNSEPRLSEGGSRSPAVQSFDLLYPKHPVKGKDASGSVLHHTDGLAESDKQSSSSGHGKSASLADMKNSRRKMDKPRKRKRDQNDPNPDPKNTDPLGLSDTAAASDLDLSGSLTNQSETHGQRTAALSEDTSVTTGVARVPSPVTCTGNSASNKTTAVDPGTLIQTSPAPEDLSIRGAPTVTSPIVSSSADSRNMSSPGVGGGGDAPSLTMGGALSTLVMASRDNTLAQQQQQQQQATHTWGPSPPGNTPASLVAPRGPSTETCTEAITSTSATTTSSSCASSSVRELEEAMNKHLPQTEVPADPLHLRTSLADYSQSVLGLGLSAHPQHVHPAASQYHNKHHKSTIQWIGSTGGQPTAPSGGTDSSGGTGGLPATNLLRTLYANRESVIRTNIYNPRPMQYYGPTPPSAASTTSTDMQNNLLTPPGGANENFAAPSLCQSRCSPGGGSLNYQGLLSSYSTSPISVSMAATSNLASSSSETYAMTPPSSVSPQDKYTSPFSEHFQGDMVAMATSSSLRGGAPYSQDGSSSMTMPIKPQAYPLPAHASAVASYERPGQYTGYYGASTFSPYNGHPSHHSTSPTHAHYRDSRAANGVW